jgi:hypothetical protein
MHDTLAGGLLAACCVLGVVAGATGTVAGVAQDGADEADDGPSLARAPIEFSALESGDEHIGVQFAETIDPDDYAFTVRNATGHVVADPTVNGWFSDPSEGYLWLELEKDLHADDLVLSLDAADSDARHEYDLTTTGAFFQHEYPNRSDTAVGVGNDVAVVDIPGREPVDSSYTVRNGNGEPVLSGSTGAETFVSRLDTATLDEGEYSIAFDNPGESGSLVVGTPDAGPPSSGSGMPGYVTSRTEESVNDENGFEPGTTISFPYDQGFGIGRVKLVLNSTEHLGDEVTLDQLSHVPSTGVRTATGERIAAPTPDGEVVSLYNVYFDEGTTEPATLRVPVYVGQAEYGHENLSLVHYTNGSWTELNATVAADERFDGYHRLVLEGHADSTSLFAVVAD